MKVLATLHFDGTRYRTDFPSIGARGIVHDVTRDHDASLLPFYRRAVDRTQSHHATYVVTHSPPEFTATSSEAFPSLAWHALPSCISGFMDCNCPCCVAACWPARVCSSQSVTGSGYIHRTSSDTAHTSQEIISADPLGVSTSLSAPYTVAGLLKTIAGTDSTNSGRLVQTLYRRG